MVVMDKKTSLPGTNALRRPRLTCPIDNPTMPVVKPLERGDEAARSMSEPIIDLPSSVPEIESAELHFPSESDLGTGMCTAFLAA
jgi:hypothetical protein